MSATDDAIRRALAAHSDEAMWSLIHDQTVCFWVDWREVDQAIVEYCEIILQTGKLSAEIVDEDDEHGFEMFIQFGQRRVKVPLVIGVEDRHITVHTLNQLLLPDLEIRYVLASNGNDGAAFLPLSSNSWKQLENEFPAEVEHNFLKIESSLNLFTEIVPLPQSRQPKKMKWWQFWS